MRIVQAIGARAPLHPTVGQAVPAGGRLRQLRDYASARDWRRTLAIARHAAGAGRDLSQRQGWATDNEEAELGVRCVAAAIRDDGGHLIAALSLSTPADRMKPHWGPLVKAAAVKISHAIGHVPGVRIGTH